MSTGDSHTLAIGANGTTYAWGNNNSGALGDGGTSRQNAPVAVQKPTDGIRFVKIAAAGGSDGYYSRSMAVGTNRAVYTWGNNNFGQSGPVTSKTPVKIAVDGVEFTDVAAGLYHSLALDGEGNVWAWGSNANGQLGLPSVSQTSTPTKITAPAGVKFTAISAGDRHSLALGDDHRIYAWGSNVYGQLGIAGTSTKAVQPTVVNTPADVDFKSISAGTYASGNGNSHSLAVDTGGNVWAWGSNSYGKLGIGSTGGKSTTPIKLDKPTNMPSNVNFAGVSAGNDYSLALDTDGKAWGWGYNSYGQIGNNSIANSSAPVPVQMPAGVKFVALSAGTNFSMAKGDDNKAYMWGDNVLSQLARPGTSTPHIPGAIANFSLGEAPTVTVDSISFDGTPVVATTNPGTGKIEVAVPPHGAGKVEVKINWSLIGESQAPASLDYTYYPTHVITYDPGPGSLPANAMPGWVANGADDKGTGVVPCPAGGSAGAVCVRAVDVAHRPHPQAPRPVDPTRVDAGAAGGGNWRFDGWRTADGKDWDFSKPVTGDMTLTAAWTQATMAPTSGLDIGGTGVKITQPAGIRFVSVSGDGKDTLALDQYGHIWSWGGNDTGQLGRTADTDYNDVPGMVDASGVFTEVSASYTHSNALDRDGHVWSWGSNDNGELGRATPSDGDAAPGMVSASATFVSVASGGSALYQFSGALDQNGSVWSWGNNSQGQLGRDGLTSVPGKVTAPVSFKDISLGARHSLAVDDDGGIWSWGNNDRGQLGRAGSTGVPGKVAASASFIEVSAGSSHSLALDKEGGVWSWGANENHQLGRDSTGNSDGTPAEVSMPATFRDVSGGIMHSSALTRDGHVWEWGNNTYRQLGREDSSSRDPEEVVADTTFDSVSGRGSHDLALDTNGRLISWGQNNFGQLGRVTMATIGGYDWHCKEVTMPVLQVSSVRFGGVPGSAPRRDAGSTAVWSANAPAHAAGANLPVAVSWSLGGAAQPDLGFRFTYIATHVVTYDPGKGVFPGAAASSAPCPAGSASGSRCVRVTDGDRTSQASVPTRKDWAFLGWYNGATPYDFTGPVTADGLVLTARWTQFNLSEMSGPDTGGVSVRLTQSEGASTTPLTVTGVTFGGGSDAKSVAVVGSPGGPYSLSTPRHRFGDVPVTVSYTDPAASDPGAVRTYTLPAGYTYHPTVTGLPFTGNTAAGWMLLLTTAGLVLLSVSLVLRHRLEVRRAGGNCA